MFVDVNHMILKQLARGGYNVLKSTSEWGDESPTFRPAKIEGDVFDYLMRLNIAGKLPDNRHFLVISEALTIPEDQLFGVVWVD